MVLRRETLYWAGKTWKNSGAENMGWVWKMDRTYEGREEEQEFTGSLRRVGDA